MNNDRAIESDFLFLIYDVAQLVRRHADKRARVHGMTRAQWAVLARLEREPGITQSRLAMLTDVEPITIEWPYRAPAGSRRSPCLAA
jgi:hypothetical protein